MILEGLIAIIVFALVPLAIKFTAATPLTICTFRLLIAVTALSVIWKQKINFKVFNVWKENSWRLWLIGIIFFLHWITYAYAVKLGGASIGVIGLSTYGIQLVFASVFFLGHRITKKDIFCFLLSIAGLIMIIPSWDFKDNVTFGFILSIISATFFAFLPILHQKTKMFNQETRIFGQFFGALCAFMLLIGETNWQLSFLDWIALLFLGVFGTLIAHSLWARVSTKASAAHSGLAYYTIGPLTILLSYLLLDEKVTMLQLTGAGIVIASAVINFLGIKKYA